MSLILASASPRRRELLERVGIAVEVRPADVDESVLPGEAVLAYAERVARDKARTIAADCPDTWVLAADTVVEEGREALGKPADAEEARAMLGRLSGKVHRVTTAVALAGPEAHLHSFTVTTEVHMRAIGESECEDYLRAGEWRGKAGGYAVQGMAAAFVTEVRGSITNVIGLPLAEVLGALERVGAARPCYERGQPA